MSTRIILALTILAAGAAGCSDSKKETTPAQIGTGTSTSTSTNTDVDAGVATIPDTSVPLAQDTAGTTTPDTGATVGPDSGIVTTPDAGGTPKEIHLAIINGSAATGVTPVTVAGTTPPTYDPDTRTCK